MANETENKTLWAYPVRVPVDSEAAKSIESVFKTNPTEVSRGVMTTLFGADAQDRILRVMGSIARAAGRGVALTPAQADAEDRAFQRVVKLRALVSSKEELGLPVSKVETDALASAETAYNVAIGA